MRQKQITGDRQMQMASKKEPLTEGIQKKKKRRPQNFFTKMSDDELINYAKRFIEENGIKTQANLKKVDGSLCQVLRNRKVIHVVISPKRELRSWKSMSDEEFIQFAKDFIAKNDIKNRNNLNMADSGLYYALIRRNLLTAVIPNKQKQGSHDILSDEELIKSAKKFIEEKGIESRSDFQKVGSGLYGTLTRRNLLDIVISSKRKIRDRGFFTNMHDEELVEFAKSFVKEKKIKARSELEKADGGLCCVLRKRNLIEQVIPEKYGRDWSSMTNKEILVTANKFIKEKNIKTRKDLEKADNGLICILRKRDLLNQIIPEKYGRDWKSMSNEEIVEFAKSLVKENGIKSRKELISLDQSFYQVLRQRKLMDDVIPYRTFRYFKCFSDEELVKHIRDLMKNKGINSRRELEEKDRGLYRAAERRGLLDRIAPVQSTKWSNFADEELVKLAQDTIKKKNITSREELDKEDSSLCSVLRRRGLLDKLIPRLKIDWSKFTDEELMVYTKKLMSGQDIKYRNELIEASSGLYAHLKKRGLLDKIIPDKLTPEWNTVSDEEVISIAEKFIRENNIDCRGKLGEANPVIYQHLRKRGLLDRVLPEKREMRDWSKFSNKKLLEYAKDFVNKNRVSSRSKLAETDSGLHAILYRRNLLDAVFSDIEQAKKTEAVKQVVDAMKEF